MSQSLLSRFIQKVYKANKTGRDQWIAQQASEVPAGSYVLDIGAGSCPYRNLFAHCEYKTHDFKQLKPQQLRGREGYDQIDYVSDIVSIPVADSSFDVIICTEVLEHVPYPIQVVHEIARILRPGGRLLLTAPLGSGVHQMPYHFYGGYTSYWYQKFLGEAGFDEPRILPNGGFFRNFAQANVRFVLESAPWRGGKQLLFLPIWLLALPWCGLVAPALSVAVDDLFDTHKLFTVGYLVHATKAKA